MKFKTGFLRLGIKIIEEAINIEEWIRIGEGEGVLGGSIH